MNGYELIGSMKKTSSINSSEGKSNDMAAQSSVPYVSDRQEGTYLSWTDQSTSFLTTNNSSAVPTPFIADVRHHVKHRLNHYLHPFYRVLASHYRAICGLERRTPLEPHFLAQRSCAIGSGMRYLGLDAMGVVRLPMRYVVKITPANPIRMQFHGAGMGHTWHVTGKGHNGFRGGRYWSCCKYVRMLSADSVFFVGRIAALCRLWSDLCGYLRAVYSGPKVVLRSKHVRNDPELFDSVHARRTIACLNIRDLRQNRYTLYSAVTVRQRCRPTQSQSQRSQGYRPQPPHQPHHCLLMAVSKHGLS